MILDLSHIMNDLLNLKFMEDVSISCVFLPLFMQDSYSYVRSTASAVGYDSKQYYQQPTATAAVAAAQPQPSVADSYYQSGMVEYTLLVVCFTITKGFSLLHVVEIQFKKPFSLFKLFAVTSLYL